MMQEDHRQELRELWRNLQQKILEKWNRTLPFGDYIVDRWEKAKLLGFGDGASVYDNVLIIGDVTVGAHTWIGPNVVLDGSGGGLTIGNYCSISAGVQIYTHQTVEWATSLGKKQVEKAPTSIGNGVYIGPNTVISMGVSIGDRAIIGAMSMVNRDVESGKKAWGCPAVIRGDSPN
jgi:acetyltransferase-like isoleucine patch superfamily enzyme